MKQFLFIPLAILLAGPALTADSQVGGRASPGGSEEIQLDLPGAEHLKNRAGADGSGLCVFTSLEIAGHWQNAGELRGFQEKMTHEPGGGWPEKVDAMLSRYAPHVRYVQYTGPDAAILKVALKTGRMASVTYGYSPRYGRPIAHMVDLVHLSDRWACVLDNNFPGEEKYEWMPPAEFVRRWQMGGGGWAVILLEPGPPPIPVNATGHDWQPGRVIGGCPRGGCCPASRQGEEQPGKPDLVVSLPGDNVVPLSPLLLSAAPCLPVGRGRCCSDQCTCGCNDGGACPCRGRPAPSRQVAQTREENFGVDLSKIPEGECCTVNGVRVSAARARNLVAGSDGLDDDSARWHVTVIGSEAECSPVLQDLQENPALAAWKERLLVQAYRPGDWAVANIGMATHGHPSIVVQAAPDARGRGRVLHRQEDYQGGAVALAEALRKADPSYDPARDPDRRRSERPVPFPEPSPPPQPSLGAAHWCCGGLLLTVLYLVFRRKQ